MSDFDDYLEATKERPIHFSMSLPSQTSLEDTEVIRAYVDAELCRALVEALDQWETEQLLDGTRLKGVG